MIKKSSSRLLYIFKKIWSVMIMNKYLEFLIRMKNFLVARMKKSEEKFGRFNVMYSRLLTALLYVSSVGLVALNEVAHPFYQLFLVLLITIAVFVFYPFFLIINNDFWKSFSEPFRKPQLYMPAAHRACTWFRKYRNKS